jgi:hypothetical protein
MLLVPLVLLKRAQSSAPVSSSTTTYAIGKARCEALWFVCMVNVDLSHENDKTGVKTRVLQRLATERGAPCSLWMWLFVRQQTV